jgi:hypothetical protein
MSEFDEIYGFEEPPPKLRDPNHVVAQGEGKVKTIPEKQRMALKGAGLMTRLTDFALMTPPDKDDPDFETKNKRYIKSQITPTHVQAINVALSKLVPSLTSVEQKIVDERDGMSREQIMGQMKAMMEADPEIKKLLKEMLE